MATIPHVERIARICHAVNRVYCQSIGDWSQPAWENALEWQKDSAIEGVKYLFHNPEASPEDSHNCWVATKEVHGWTYGLAKDAGAKTHPCMVPYAQLPEEQKVKDELFHSIVKAYIG